jgi:tRNA U34 5-methylaminomethyl-2-thiouridine-forming methyltransferase MnmC
MQNNPTKKAISIFEVGFGTGLNTFLSVIENGKEGRSIYYEAIDTNPLKPEEYNRLHYANLFAGVPESTFNLLHNSKWNEDVHINPTFILHKKECSLLEYRTTNRFDLIYFDAFAPSSQPELWGIDIFQKMYSITTPGGMLVTYCAKGAVRRAMIAAGYKIEKLRGAPGKREMLRASRPASITNDSKL